MVNPREQNVVPLSVNPRYIPQDAPGPVADWENEE
jgi:hypothetical protein